MKFEKQDLFDFAGCIFDFLLFIIVILLIIWPRVINIYLPLTPELNELVNSQYKVK